MRLSDYTDYSLRVLMYCASQPGQLVTIAELADYHGVSKNHLMKVVNDLARQGVLETTRGRGGGLRLSRPAEQICIGDIVRASETDFRLVECFDPQTNACTLTATCRLKHVFTDALKAYFSELDRVTLADIAPKETARSLPVVGGARRTVGARKPIMLRKAAPVTRKRTA